MSAHKGKKKRLGSRRRVAHLNETAEPEELPGTDRAPLAQWHIPEHGPDSPSLLLNPNHSQADSQHASSSEVLENNGGKGSSQQRPESAKDFATEQGHKPTEEVEENMGNETLEVTQRRQAVQDKTLMKLSPTNEHDILSVTQMYSAPMPEAELEKNVQEETRNDPIQSAADSVQVRENQHLFGTILSGGLSSHPTVNEQVIDETTMPQKQLPHASNAEIEKLHENKDLSWQDGVNQTKNLASEAHVDLRDMEPLATSEITTEKNSLGKRTEIENIEQAACFSPTVEQVEHSNFPEHSGEVALHENKVALTEVHQIKDSFEQIVHDVKEDADTCSANPMVPATICDREKSDLGVKDSDNSVPTQVLYPSDKQEENVTNTDESQISSTEISDTALNQLHEGGDQGMNYVQLGFKGFLGRVEEGESSLQTVPFGIDVPLESQSEDNRLRSEEQSDKSLNPMKSRRKFGSRRRNKGSYAKESADVSHESPEDIAGYIRDEAPFDTEEMSFTSETGVQEEVCDPVKENVPLGISESTSSKNKDEKEPENLQFVEEFTYSSPKKEEQTELFNFLEVKALQSSHDGDNNVPAHSDICDTNASELIVKSIDDPATQQEALNPLDKQEEHNTKVNMAVLDQRDENPPNTEETQISSTEVPDSALSQVHEGEDQDVVDVKLSAEGFFSGFEKATLESQSDDNPLKTEEETDNSFNPMRSRRKMGSSRRHKGSHHVKESVVEQFHESPEDVAGNIRDEESSATTERSFARETAVQEESLEPVLKEMDKLDRPQKDQVKESASVGISEFTSSNLLSVPPCHQMMIDQSDSGEMQTEENLTHRVVTEIMESGGDQELFMECGHAQFLEEIFPSKEGEEHDENFSLSEGKELEIAGDADSDLQITEIKGPQILESEHFESNIHDVTESSANRIVQSEISDTNESEVSVKSPTNSATQHKVVNPDDKQQKQPMKDNSMEVKVEGFLGRGEETGSLQTIQFKTDAPLESQNKDNPLSTEEETENSFNPMRSRRTQAEGVNDWINESTPDSISEFTSSNLMPLTEEDPWVLVQSDTKEMPNQEIPSVSSETDIENKDGDFSKPPEKSLPRETEVKEDHTEGVHDQVKENVPVGVSEFTSSDLLSVSPENKDEKDFSKQHENWQFVGETMFSSQKGEEQSEPFSLLEVKDLESPHESIGDSASQQEVLHLDDKQEKHNPKENIMEVLDQRDENPSITEETQISNTERPDTASLQVHEGEDQDVVDVKLSAEGFISGFEKAEASSPTIASEINAMLESQSEDNPLKTEEETDNSFNPMRSKRKMGSSRRHKRSQHAKESVAEAFHESPEYVAGNIKGKEPSVQTGGSFATETTVQEESLEPMQEMDKLDMSQSDQVKESVGISEFPSSKLLSVSPGQQVMIDQSRSDEMQTENNLTGGSVTENKEREEDQELFKESRHVKFLDEIFPSKEGEEHGENFSLFEGKELEIAADADSDLHNLEIKGPQIHESEHSESNIYDLTEFLDSSSANRIVQGEISVKSTADSAAQHKVLNPDDKQQEHHMKDNIMDVLDQREENASNTEESQISSTERTDTSLVQVHDSKDQNMDDVKLSVEGFLGRGEETEISHEDNPLSTEEETETFNLMKSRRKMGSSRRHKGRGHIKESGAETFHESSEDVAEDISDKDPSEKTQKSFTIETTMQEESVETVVEDMDKLDITQAEGVNDWINESTPDSISEFTSSNLMPLTEGNPWVLVQSDTKEMPNQQIPSVSSETDIENKNEGFSKQPEKSLPRETEVKEDQTEGVHDQVKENVPVGVSEFTSSDLLSISPENKDEKDFSKQHENWQFVDETIFSSQIGEEQSEPFNLLEVKDLESPHESDKSAHDHSDICDTNASEPIVKSIGDSASQQEVLHLDDKQEKHNPNENIMEVSDQRDENLSITEETQISNTERPDTALFQVHAGEDQDVKLGAEGFISGVDEAKSSLQTIAPEINAPLETQSECNPMSTEEETENSFTPMKSRRKMGSSRRHKGRGHAKESGADTFHESSEDVAKNISDEDPSETTERAFTIEATIQEKSVETVVEDMDKLDITQTEGDNDQIKESTPDSIMPLSEGDPSVLVQSDSKEMPNEELLSVYAVTDSENKERDEDEDLPRHTQDDYQSLLKAEGVVFANMSETTNEIEYSVEKENMSSPNGKQSAKEEDDEHLKLSRVKDAQPSVGDLNNVYQQEIKPMEMQGAHSSGSSLLEESTSSQTSLPGLESPLDSQSQGNPGLHKLRGNKRKLGSSRRIKGSHVRAESPTEPNVAKNTTGDGSSDTVPFDKMPTETTETDANSVTEEGKMISIENDKDESKEPMQEEDTTLPLNIGDNTSGNDDSLKPTEEEIQIEPDILSHLTGHDSIKVEVVDDSALGDNKETREKELYTVTETEDEKKEEQRDADQKDIGERHEDSPDEPFSVSRIKTETLLLLDVGIGEDTSEPAVDSSVDGESPKAESPHKKYPTQTKRKLGSTRRSQLHRKPEEGMDNSNTKEMDFNADVQHFGTMGEAEEAPLIVSAEVLQNQKAEPPLTTVHEVSTDQDLQRKPSSSAPDLISSTENVMSFLSEKPSSLVEEVNNFFQAPDIKDGHAHTGDTLEQQTRQEDINVTRGQDNLEVAAQESKYMSEEGDDTEMQSESLNLTNRRRKMGSTRKGLRAARDEENLHHLQGVNNEATDAVTDVDILTESVSGVEEEEEPKANDEHKDSKTSGEKAEQRAGERAVSGQLGEIEHHLAPLSVPSLPDASPSLDTMSESTPGRRRRKMGSHRKSHGHDTPTETEPGSALKTIMDESLLETQEQRGPDNKSQVEEGSKKSLLNISPSETGELSAPVTRNKAPQRVAAPQHPTVNPGQKSGISIADSSTENSYNVVMVGDSGVGKTSFMKRAQSGKFSLDIPSSIGLDTCMWTVLIDGKPVVLQLWDTAGQERFHSITRQVFHRAQAFLLMYDISSSQTFTAIRYWAECIQEGAMENVPILLVGNKSDHAKRQVTPEEGETLAKEHNFDFMECSAATGDNVVQSLETVARLLKQRADRREEPLVLLKDTQRKASGCC